MPVVTECDDGFLNDVTTFPRTDADVFEALDRSDRRGRRGGLRRRRHRDAVHGSEGGIGTASRVVSGAAG